MRTRNTVLILTLALTLPLGAKEKPKNSGAPGDEVKPKPLTEKQREDLLARRRDGAMFGSFNSYASMLFALDNIVTHTDDSEAAATRLNSPFPEFYKPTGREFFNAIARQMNCSWSYDSKRAYWVFAKPARPMPFKVTLAKDWLSEHRGNYLFCKPPAAPVGMDIYVMAEYSTAPADPLLAGKMRDATAIMFAKGFKEDVTVKDMTPAKVGTYESLHYKVPTPRPGVTWRQWAIAENGQAIVIVSAIKDADEKDILPGIEEALKTFEIRPDAPVPEHGK